MRGNATRALRALDSPVTSTWHDRGVVHEGSHRFLLLGIDSSCRGKPGGEVTRQGVDGGVLIVLGCPRWPWRWPGRRGVRAT
jgi:hypothetical protein